ncbi:MFS transporter [Methylobacterium oryzisoli]|uniref:MFS transporter n=1 Tax=Methylobacterium oryzisoli TaxID=3385502 RepID=UPI003891797B
MSRDGEATGRRPALDRAAWPMREADRAPSISDRLDRLPVTRLHLAMTALCTLGLFADIAEVALSNALAAIFIAPPYGIPRGDLALFLASVFIGGAVGAPLFGLLGDRFGRRRALQASLTVMALGSLAAAASPDLTTLTIARCITGFAIGGYPPLAASYLSDVLPPARRGTMMFISTGLGFLGAPAVILLIRGLTPVLPPGVEAWRIALAAGGVIAVLAALLFARLPESPRWLASFGRGRQADSVARRFERAAGVPSPPAAALGPDPAEPTRTGWRALAADRRSARRTALFFALFALGPFATIGFPLLSAAVLIQKGFKVDQSLLFAALSMVGPSLGTVAAALVVDRFGRRTCLVATASTMIAMGTLFAESVDFTALMLAGIAFNTAAAIYAGILTLYCTELLPTPLRASALTIAWAAGRIAASLVPILLLPLLTDHGARAMFAAITAALSASILLTLTGPRGLTGKPVA